MLLAEWNSIGSKIEDAIKGAFDTATGPTKGFFSIFSRDTTVTIVITKTGSKCKVNDGIYMTLNLRLDYLNDADLQATITSAVQIMAAGAGEYELE